MISKDRNLSSYNYYSISRFLHGQILFHLDNPDPNPVERKTISNPNPKKFKYPAGLDSKIRILHITALSVDRINHAHLHTVPNYMLLEMSLVWKIGSRAAGNIAVYREKLDK